MSDAPLESVYDRSRVVGDGVRGVLRSVLREYAERGTVRALQEMQLGLDALRALGYAEAADRFRAAGLFAAVAAASQTGVAFLGDDGIPRGAFEGEAFRAWCAAAGRYVPLDARSPITAAALRARLEAARASDAWGVALPLPRPRGETT